MALIGVILLIGIVKKNAIMMIDFALDAQREHRTGARRGKRREDGDGVNVALVEHPEHDVDRGQRRQDQDRLVAERLLVGAAGTLEAAVHRRGHVDLVDRSRDRRLCIAQ